MELKGTFVLKRPIPIHTEAQKVHRHTAKIALSKNVQQICTFLGSVQTPIEAMMGGTSQSSSKPSKTMLFKKENEQIFYIVKVISDKKIDFEENKYQEIKKTLDKSFATNNLEQLVYMLEKKYPIKINNNFINSFIKTME